MAAQRKVFVVVRLYLLRHGETRYNRENLGLGRADIELTEVGKNQSELAADSLQEVVFDMIYSSPLSRAAYLANLVAREGNRTVQRFDALMEMDVGKTEGMKLSDVRDMFPIFIKEWAGPNKIHAAMPGGESLTDIEVRVESVLDDLKSYKEGNIAIIAHNFVLRILICKILGLSVTAFNSFVLDLASITIMEMIPYPHILRLNDTCHLR